MKQSTLRFAVVLGLVSAIGPFAIDMYLPALPSIGKDMGASPAAVQMSLMMFFIALAAGQMIYGPVSDMVGRKAPLYFGLGIFAIGSIGCALSPNIETLIAFRFVQGIGACAGMVVPRAVVRDLHTGNEAAQLMSLLMLVFSVSPILAPLSGSGIIALFTWRGVFWAVLVASMIGLCLIAFALPETRPKAERVDSTFGSAMSAYGQLLLDPRFMGLTLTGGFGIASFFAYLANSSFVLINHYGLTPTQYSIAFSVNAISFMGMAQLNGVLGKRFGLINMMRWAVLGYAVAMAVLFLVTLAGVDSLVVLAALLFIGFGFLGLVLPTSAVLALDDHGPIAGTASALMGTLQFACGAIVIAIIGLFDSGSGARLPMVGAIAASAIATFILAQLSLPRRKAAEAVAG